MCLALGGGRGRGGGLDGDGGGLGGGAAAGGGHGGAPHHGAQHLLLGINVRAVVSGGELSKALATMSLKTLQVQIRLGLHIIYMIVR